MTTTSVAHTDTRSGAARVALMSALVAAAGFATEGVITLVHHTGDHHWDGLSQALNTAYAIAAVALIFALPMTGRWLRVNRAGWAGVVTAQIGYAAMAVESIASGIHDGNTLGVLFLLGLLLSLIGLLVLGITALLSGHARWAALLPFLGMLVATAGGDHGGSIALAAVWLVLGVVQHRSAP